jgi:hypothetical protein
MSGNVVEFPTSEASVHTPAREVPQLPIEQHIVAAALKAERLRSLSEQLLLVFQHAPRDGATYARVHDEALAAWCDMDDHYQAYRAVLECRGQA